MRGGACTGLRATSTISIVANLLVAACPRQADLGAATSSRVTCGAGPSVQGVREQGLAHEAPRAADGESDPLDVALFQVNVLLSGSAAQLESGPALKGCFDRGFVLVMALILPFSASIVMLSCVLSTRLENSRRQAQGSGESPQVPCGKVHCRGNGEDQEVSGVVLAFVLMGTFLLNLNFTIVLPSSEHIMLKAGGSTFLSGVAIGAYALGSIISLPFIMHCSRHSYRTGVLFIAAVALVGNIAYAAMGSIGGSIGIVGMITARLACGLEGGIMVMFAIVLTHLSSGKATARAMAKLVMSSSLGLVLGPAASSLSQYCFPGYQAEIPPAAFMAACAAAYGALAFCWFPSQSECFDAVGLSDYRVATMGSSSETYTDLEVKRGWAYLGVLSVAYVCRMFQRVCWEAGVLVLLVQDYGLTTKQAGLVMALPVMASLPLVLASDLLGSFGTVNATRILTLWELLGIVLMVRLVPASTQGLVLLLVGSAIFYGTNWMTIVPLAPLRARFALKGHWALNVETSSAISWAFAFLGQFYGPLVSRALLNVCLSQNLLASCFTVVWVSVFVATEVGLNTLLSREQLHLGKQTAWEWS
eukprot:CAMPEP_0171185318 /NCGR_PEP_ID=MMETSP0790-20130122/16240_1 /TAXON_ID=2925 /ORGANISM="Alexandrium catenella, Strain OF101" /LENGTH=588 /DNA_ID=CAMNT_0011650337 /DNA_START=107 /DNA_END=1873 /DNA_ORIENTATION=-